MLRLWSFKKHPLHPSNAITQLCINVASIPIKQPVNIISVLKYDEKIPKNYWTRLHRALKQLLKRRLTSLENFWLIGDFSLKRLLNVSVVRNHIYRLRHIWLEKSRLMYIFYCSCISFTIGCMHSIKCFNISLFSMTLGLIWNVCNQWKSVDELRLIIYPT